MESCNVTRAVPRKGTFRYRVYIEVRKRSLLFGRASTPKDIIRALLCSDEPEKHSIIRAHLSELSKNGYLKKLGSGQYAAVEFRKVVQPATFREVLLQHLQKPVTVVVLEKIFPGKSVATIRGTLTRLKKQGFVVKDGPTWVIAKKLT